MGLKKGLKKVGKGVKKTIKNPGRRAKKLVVKPAEGLIKTPGTTLKKLIVEPTKKIGTVVEDGILGGVHVLDELGDEFSEFLCNIVGKEPGVDCHVQGGVVVTDDGTTLTDGDGNPSDVVLEDEGLSLEGLWSWSREQDEEKFGTAEAWTFHPPLDEIFVTSGFGPRTLGGVRRFHAAVDLRAPVGTTVYSSGPAVVLFAGATDKFPRAGVVVTLRYAHGLESQYMHLSRVLVKPGDVVLGRTPVGLTGESGSAKGQPHLHAVLKLQGKLVDPTLVYGKRMKGGTTVTTPATQ